MGKRFFSKNSKAWSTNNFSWTWLLSLSSTCQQVVCRGGSRTAATSKMEYFLPICCKSISISKFKIMNIFKTSYDSFLAIFFSSARYFEFFLLLSILPLSKKTNSIQFNLFWKKNRGGQTEVRFAAGGACGQHL